MEQQNSETNKPQPKVDLKTTLGNIQDIEKKKENISFSEIIKLYIVPLILVLIFVFIMVFLVLGKIGDLFNGIGEINTRVDEISKQEQEIVTLKRLNSNSVELNDQVNLINSLAPTGNTEVVKFQQTVTDLASKQPNLVATSSSLVEEKDSETSDSPLSLNRIPSAFNVAGPLLEIKSFINDLSKLQDFIIVEQMSLIQRTNSEWNLEFTVTKYQFTETGDAQSLTNFFSSVPLETQIHPAIQKYLEERNLL